MCLIEYSFYFRHPETLDPIIDETLAPEAYVSDELTARDIFYREVSTIHLLLPTLVNSAREMTQSEKPTQQVSQYILKVNSILLVSFIQYPKVHFYSSIIVDFIYSYIIFYQGRSTRSREISSKKRRTVRSVEMFEWNYRISSVDCGNRKARLTGLFKYNGKK